jgi:hypothetical protein
MSFIPAKRSRTAARAVLARPVIQWNVREDKEKGEKMNTFPSAKAAQDALRNDGKSKADKSSHITRSCKAGRAKVNSLIGDFTLVKRDKYSESKHANERRRQRTTLSSKELQEFAKVESNSITKRCIIRNNVIVTVLPKQFKKTKNRNLFIMLYRKSAHVAYAVKCTALQNRTDQTRYPVYFKQLADSLSKQLIRGTTFTAVMVDQTLKHDSIEVFEQSRYS